MIIQTKFLGEVEVDEKNIYTFAAGLPGFEDERKFALLPLDADLPLAFLQSTEKVEVGFVVTLPFAIKTDYAFDLLDEDKDELEIESSDDVLVYSIMTLNEPFSDSTINLLAPIVLNVKNNKGKQIVIQDQSDFSLQYPISSFEGSAK